MSLTARHRLVIEATSRRDEAEALLRVLLDAKACSERNLASIRQQDFMKKVTGRSAMDNAIASTQRLIEAYNRVLRDLRSNLTDEDAELLGELEEASEPCAD